MSTIAELLELDDEIVSEGSMMTLTISRGDTYVSYEGPHENVPQALLDIIKKAFN